MARLHITKRKILMGIGAVLIVAASVGAGVFVFWMQHKDQPTQVDPYSAQKEQSLPKSAEDAQNLAINGDIKGSNQKINDALNQSNVSDNDKYDLYIQQGVNFSNQQQYQQALDSFKKAEAIKKDFTVSHLLGEQAEALGDKQSAITYYKQAIQLLSQNSPSYNSDKRVYEQKIRDLGGTP